MDMLITKQKPVMLVGSAGSGKTVSVAAKLNALPDSYAITNAPLNFYTTSGKLREYCRILNIVRIKLRGDYLLIYLFIHCVQRIRYYIIYVSYMISE